MPDRDRRASVKIARGINAFFRKDEERERSADQALRITDPFRNRGLLVDQRRDKLGRIDLAAAHFQEMPVPAVEKHVRELICVIDLADGGDGIGAVVGADEDGLGLEIGNAADAQMPLQF